MDQVNSEFYYIPAYFDTAEGKVFAAALYDTGASVSLITPRFCRQLGLRWTEKGVTLETVGSGVKSRGYLETMLGIGQVKQLVTFEVIENSIAEVLMGKPDGEKFGFQASGPIFCQKDGTASSRVVAAARRDVVRGELRAILVEFEPIFARSEYDVGLIHGSELRIRLKEDRTIYCRPRKYPEKDQELIQAHVQACLDAGLIRPSESSFSSQITLAKAEDKPARVCIDYRRLNDITEPDRYPIPVIEEIIQELQGAKCFSKLDLVKGYHQMRVADQDIHKTAFAVKNGLYEWLSLIRPEECPGGIPEGNRGTYQAMQRICYRLFRRYHHLLGRRAATPQSRASSV